MRRFVIRKHEGETPLEALSRARVERGISDETPLTYAGRLDPMAKGTLLILVGEECKRQRAYHDLDKEYVFEILFGFRSDTGDILGMPEADKIIPAIDEVGLKKVARELHGDIALPYPRFSSRTVKGKPLFQWTLEERLGEIEIPVARTKIYDLRHTSTREISYALLREDILRRIALPTAVTEESKRLGADFRRNDIVPAWERLLQSDGTATIASFRTIVSAGTYIRSLAPHIADHLGTLGLAYSIERSRIGTYAHVPILRTGFWVKDYRSRL